MKSGRKLSGRYKIKRPIGTGGMANVYEAHDLILDRDVAVKVLRYDFRNDEDTIRRFKREALAATELVHPNIVSIYDVGEEENNQYIVMEYVKGMDLKQYIQKSYPIAYPKVIKIMRQILSAVEYAHQNQVIHRDLKPQNILIDDNERVKITDFGIAVAVSQSSITQTNSLLGSVHYLSPEQARGGMATKQSDIYSLGIILYELLIGKVPFEGESAVSIALKHFQESIPSVKNIDHLIPQSLENVVLKATAKDTSSRYGTVDEMAVDLETALSPKRSNEEIFTPTIIDEETRLLTPIDSESSLYVKQEKSNVPVVTANKSEKGKTPLNKKPIKNGKKLKFFLLLIAVVFFLGILFIWFTPKNISIPDVSGLTEEKARSILTEADLTIRETKTEPSEEIKEDLVIRTDPGKGAVTKKDSTVILFLSSGKKSIAFQDYIGESYEEARAALTDKGFVVKRNEQSSDSVAEGLVIDQSIEKDEEVVPSETTVTLIVSSGKKSIKMRDLDGYSKKGVEDYAKENGLELVLDEKRSEEIPKGYVISQSIEPEKLFYKGDSLSVVISEGPEEVNVERFNITVNVPYKVKPAEKVELDSLKDSEDSTAKTGEKSKTGSEEVEEKTEDEPEEKTEDEPEEKTEDEPNEIKVYLEDEENSMDDTYMQLSINEDTDIVLTFHLKDDEKGSYRITRDGELLEEKTDISPK